MSEAARAWLKRPASLNNKISRVALLKLSSRVDDGPGEIGARQKNVTPQIPAAAGGGRSIAETSDVASPSSRSASSCALDSPRRRVEMICFQVPPEITAFDNSAFFGARVLLQQCVELDVFSTMAIFFAAPPLPLLQSLKSWHPSNSGHSSNPGRGLFFRFIETIVQYHKRPQF
jgi:hypothetical protein